MIVFETETRVQGQRNKRFPFLRRKGHSRQPHCALTRGSIPQLELKATLALDEVAVVGEADAVLGDRAQAASSVSVSPATGCKSQTACTPRERHGCAPGVFPCRRPTVMGRRAKIGVADPQPDGLLSATDVTHASSSCS